MPTGRFRCDDGGIYYMREEADGEVVWFGEDDQPGLFYDARFTSRRFANVFRGSRNGATIEGNFYDLPKGKASGMGSLRLQVVSDNQLRQISSSGFGGTVWNRITDIAILSADSNFSSPEFQGSGPEDVTGTWMGSDGGSYYLRQIADDRVVWFGEHPSGSFANVFFGVRSLEPSSFSPSIMIPHFRGQWFDIPKLATGTWNRGELHLVSPWVPAPLSPGLQVLASSGGFGGARWQRIDAVNIVVRLRYLTLVNNEESQDEPYLWVFFIKVDGERINVLEGDHSFISVEGKGGSGPNNLTPAEDLSQGTLLVIPTEMGYYKTTLRTLRGLPHDLPLTGQVTNLILLVVGLEEDLTNKDVVRATYDALKRNLEEVLTSEFRKVIDELYDSASDLPGTINARLAAAVTKIKRNVTYEALKAGIRLFDYGSLFDPDDIVGNGIYQFSFSNLRPGLDESPFSIDLKKFDEDDPGIVTAHYRIDGVISAA